MTNEQRALSVPCPGCGAGRGERCTSRVNPERPPVTYTLVHYARGKAAGLGPGEVLALDFTTMLALPDFGALVQLGGDDLQIMRAIAVAALTLAEQAGASPRDVTRLRQMTAKIGEAR